MGKKQHQSDKLYITTKEWKTFYGGHKDDANSKLLQAQFRRLPITHCALTFQPFENPICTQEGVIFDLMAIVPFLKKHGINPITGQKLDAKSLIHLNFHKNAEGEFHCPITYKVFTPNSHIVAIKTSGNVYNHEAIEELNLKPKIFKDLLTDVPFTRKDIIELQDPNDLDKHNIEKFHHVKFNLKAEDEEAERKAMENPAYFLKKVNTETRETLAQLEKDYKPPEKPSSSKVKPDAVNSAHYSTGTVAHGLTSTVMPVITDHVAAVLDEDILRYRRVKKKGYVRLITTKGPLNLELYCDLVPKTCENFIKLCKKRYYDDTIFHRLIRNFMVQGGDPTGKGQGGESVWGKPFKDEFVHSLSHASRGVLSMANKGENTNGSQFFIAFRPCKHLDRKHTIFGRVVGGLDSLTLIERVEVDKKDDRPLEPIKIITAQVFVDPYEEADEQLAKDREALKTEEERTKKEERAKYAKKEEDAKQKAYRPGVGKYIKPGSSLLEKKRKIDKEKAEKTDNEDANAKKKSKLVKSGGSLGNFSGW